MSVNFMSRQINRRQFAIGSAAGLAAVSILPSRSLVASAQGAADLASMGYPELAITVSATGFDGVPESTAAGRYLLKLTSSIPAGDTSNSGAIGFMSGTSIGMSAADLMQFLAGAAGGSPQGTPAEGASPTAEEQSQMLPLEVYQLHFAGGVSPPSGQTAQAVINVTPGEYVV